MARFRISGSLTYSKTADANAARSAMSSTIASHPSVAGTVGGTGAVVTISAETLDAAAAEAFHEAIVPDWGRGTRNSGGMAMVRVSES